MSKKKILVGLILLVAVMSFAGCSSKDDPETVTDAAQTDAVEGTELTDTVVDGTSDPIAEPVAIDYSVGLDENGFFEGVVALDYVDLNDYLGIEIPADIHTITDETLQFEIEGMLTYFTTNQTVMDRAIVEGDTVNIDYVGSVDGVEFEGGSTGGAGTEVTIGVTSYIDDFLEQLIGHTPGESFDIEVTFPVDYGVDELNGKDAVFAITVNSISEAIVPELTDEFVVENLSLIYPWTTVDEMRVGLRSELQDMAIREYIQTEVLASMTATSIPDELLDYQKTSIINYYTTSANSYGMTLEDYLASSTGFTTIDEFYEASMDQLIEIANNDIIYQAIAEDANLIVTDEVITDYFLEYYNMDDYSEFETQYGIEYLKFNVLKDLVVDYMIENAELL